MFWDQVYLIPLGGGAPLKMISFEVFRLPWGFDLGGPWPRFCNVLDVGGLTWAQATSSSSDLYVQISPSHPSLESGSAEFPCVDLQSFPGQQRFPEWICSFSQWWICRVSLSGSAIDPLCICFRAILRIDLLCICFRAILQIARCRRAHGCRPWSPTYELCLPR